MAGTARACLQSILKAVNMIMGVVGIAMFLYGIWLAIDWQRDMEGSSFDDFDSTAPWFVYTCIFIGIIFCLVTCLGHISADISSGFCLTCYAVTVFVLVLLEAAVAADMLLNSNWEKDLPEDQTGRFHDFKEFVESNFDLFKWIGFLTILAQGFSFLLSLALTMLGAKCKTNYDSDDEYPPARLPLVNHGSQPQTHMLNDPHITYGKNTWKHEANAFWT